MRVKSYNEFNEYNQEFSEVTSEEKELSMEDKKFLKIVN